MRLSLRVAVVRGSAASDLLRNDDEVYALSELLERAAREGTLPDMPLYRAAEVLHASGTAILPALYLDGVRPDRTRGHGGVCGQPPVLLSGWK